MSPRTERPAARPRLFASVVAAGLVAATSRGCTCWESEKTLASLERPLRVRIVETTSRGVDVDVGAGPHMGIILPVPDSKRRYEIEIGREPQARLPVPPCEGNFDLDADERGSRVAHRCGSGPWRPIFVGAQGRAFRALADGADAVIDWAKVPTFEVAAAELFRASSGRDDARAGALVDEVRHRAGEPGVRALLVATLDAPYEGSGADYCGGAKKGAWSRAFEALGPAEKEKTLAALRHVLESPAAPARALRRAVAFVDLDDPTLLEAVEARTAELADVAPKGDPIAASVLVRTLAGKRPARAGELGCRLYRNTGASKLTIPLLNASLLAVAHAKTECAVVREELERRACDAEWFCHREKRPEAFDRSGVARCSPDFYAEAVLREVARPLAERRAETCKTSFRPTFPAAALAQGPLPAAIDRKQARYLYPIEPAYDLRGSTHPPDCGQVKRGEPCYCYVNASAVADLACGLAASETFLVPVAESPTSPRPDCRIEIDDAARKVRVVGTGAVRGAKDDLAPDASLPDASLPDASLPDASLPDASLPP